MSKIIITESQLKMLLREKENKTLLNEEQYSDLFEFLAQGFRKMTQGSVYYVSSMNRNMNKRDWINPDTNQKEPNPMYDKLFKHTRYKFGWLDTFEKAYERKTGEPYVPGQQRGQYEKLEGFEMLKTGKSGLYLPILPTGTKYVFAVYENGNFTPIEKEEAKKYLKPSEYRDFQNAPKPEFRDLIVDNIYKLTGGGNVWINGDFRYNYIDPGEGN